MNVQIERQIGKNIRQLRRRQKVTQEELTVRLQLHGCDMTRSALAKIEAGQRHLYPDEIYWIKTALKVEYDDIFRLE